GAPRASTPFRCCETSGATRGWPRAPAALFLLAVTGLARGARLTRCARTAQRLLDLLRHLEMLLERRDDARCELFQIRIGSARGLALEVRDVGAVVRHHHVDELFV